MSDLLVVARRTFSATPEELFDLWTSPQALTDCMNLSKIEMDPVVGGEWRWYWTGDPAGGEYIEIDRPRRLVFSWLGVCSRGVSTGKTVITIDFVPVDEGQTEIVLHHELNDIEQVSDYTRGWNGGLESIANYLAKASRV